MVPVVDLAVRFGLPPQEVSRRSCIVIVDVDFEGEPAVTGILVDAVSQVVELRDGDIAPPPAFGTKARADDLLGVAAAGKKFVLILDVDRVLSWSVPLPAPRIAPEAETTVTSEAQKGSE